MSGTKNSSRVSTVKKDGSFRYATRFLALEKSRKTNSKETNSSKGCECTHKTEGLKGLKHTHNSKLPVKKVNSKCCSVKDPKKKSSTNHREKVVIVSKRSSSVSVVKSCNLRKSVSVKKVSYSTSVVLSSDEDIDSEEESEEEEKKEISKKRRTILKHTTSKVKSNVRETKKTEEKDKNAQKAKALKLLCNKLSYDKHNERELRPRFPYNVMQEWPTARTHRMASLNALAKVHVLYENEGRTVGENLNDADESSLIDFLNDNSDDDSDSPKESKPVINPSVKKNEKSDKNEKTKKTENEKGKKGKNKALLTKSKIPKRGKKRKLPEVEIIDTKICKRMASLNAQAILAASYLQEPKPKRIYKKVVKRDEDGKEESNCDVTIIKTEIIDDDELTEQSMPTNIIDKHDTETSENTKNQEPPSKTTEIRNKKNWSVESEVALLESSTTEALPSKRSCNVENCISSTAATKVGVTQYTEVTKVQINTNKDTEIKEESKSERKIEHIISNDDVAITTKMYRYQSKSTSESYCLQMQTTYKPASKSMSPSTSVAPNDRIHPYMNDPAVLPNNQSYYSRTSRDSMITSQAYQLNPGLGAISAVGDMDHRIPRGYGGSAFTVPHYRQAPRMQFSRNEYGYYQPAGPLIQPNSDQCTIHKPVPYHPQPNLHQPPQRPQQPSHHDGFPSFDSRHSQQSKLALSSRPHPIPPQQKSVTPSAPPVAENLPSRSSSSSQFPRSLPAEDTKNSSLNNNNSSTFNRPSKHVRSPVMPTLYSSQHNFRTYQTQKRVPNSFRNYSSQPSERKDHVAKHKDYEAPSFNQSSLMKSTSHSSSHPMDNNTLRPTEIQSHSSTHLGDHFKNHPKPINSKERTWGFKSHGTSSTMSNPNTASTNIYNSGSSHLYGQDASSSMCNPHAASNICLPGSSSMYNPGSSHFMPYQDSRKGIHSVDTHEASRHPLRPPSVIEIVEDTPRDTKTYIQLEVPKNSHREKIVVVDVEDDEIEKKRVPPTVSEKLLPALEKPPEKNIEKKCDNSSSTRKAKINTEMPQHEEVPIVKEERLSIEQDSKDVSQKTEESGNETPDVMFLEVKKKKESAVIRRARLHGKQRTFRDCYNRPLEQLMKTKKNDVSNISEQHLPKNLQPLVLLPRFVLPKLEKAPLHGWSWEGSPNDRLVYISNDDPPCMRRCYPSVRHMEGDVINVRDCVLLRSGPRKTDLPFVAKVTALWGNPTNGEMTMSLLWYYRPEHTETIKKMQHSEDEIFASKHRDTNSVACIEDKCYVLTYSEYCRYRKKCKMIEENSAPSISIVPAGEDKGIRQNRLPPLNVSPDLVLFCRKVYDYRQRRLLKNPL